MHLVDDYNDQIVVMIMREGVNDSFFVTPLTRTSGCATSIKEEFVISPHYFNSLTHRC